MLAPASIRSTRRSVRDAAHVHRRIAVGLADQRFRMCSSIVALEWAPGPSSRTASTRCRRRLDVSNGAPRIGADRPKALTSCSPAPTSRLKSRTADRRSTPCMVRLFEPFYTPGARVGLGLAAAGVIKERSYIWADGASRWRRSPCSARTPARAALQRFRKMVDRALHPLKEDAAGSGATRRHRHMRLRPATGLWWSNSRICGVDPSSGPHRETAQELVIRRSSTAGERLA
jgi:hypothetical protein